VPALRCAAPQWTKLEEIDGNGAKVQNAKEFAQSVFHWIGPEDVLVQGHAATKVTLQSTLEVRERKNTQRMHGARETTAMARLC
jgi:hypothetical protein